MMSSKDGTTLYLSHIDQVERIKFTWEEIERSFKSYMSKRFNRTSAVAWVTEWRNGDINSVPAHQVIKVWKFALTFSPLHPILSDTSLQK